MIIMNDPDSTTPPTRIQHSSLIAGCALKVGEEGSVTVVDSCEDVLVETSRNNSALVDAERVKVVRWPQGIAKMSEGQKVRVACV